MKTQFESMVRYSEVDREQELKLKSVVDYMQDACTYQSESIGEGIDVLSRRNLAWLMASWQIEIEKRPRLCDKLVSVTWPHKVKGFFAYRCHAIMSPEGEIYAKGNSIWFMIDQKALHPVKIGPREQELYQSEEAILMPFASRRVRPPKGAEPVILPAIHTVPHQIDVNDHVNNSEYIQMAQDLVPDEFRKKRSIRVEYINGAKQDDAIIPKIYINDDICTVELAAEDGRTFVFVEFK